MSIQFFQGGDGTEQHYVMQESTSTITKHYFIMLESGKRIKVLIAFVAIICFAFGFTTANSEKNVSWLGYLVHGDFATPGENFKIIPLHDGDHTAPPTSQNSSRYSPRW